MRNNDKWKNIAATVVGVIAVVFIVGQLLRWRECVSSGGRFIREPLSGWSCEGGEKG